MSLARKFCRYAIPSIISMLMFSLYTMVDGMFVARGVGEYALSAVNISTPFVSLLFAVGLMLATGTSTVISIALGQKDLKTARNYFNQNLFVTILFSVTLTVLVLLNLDLVADFLGATKNTLGHVKEYISTIAVFAVFFTVSYNLEIQVKANGAPQVSTAGVCSCGLMNIILDHLFVIRFHWGVKGAALATGLAQVTSTLVFLIYFLTHRQRLRFQRFHPQFGVYRRIIPLGFSDGLGELSNGVVILLFNQTITRVIGADAVVSYTIVSYVNTFVLMTMLGTSQGMQPLVSFYHGANDRTTCQKLLRYGLTAIVICSVASLGIGECCAELIVSIFLERSSAMFNYSIGVLHVYTLSFVIVGFNVLLAGFFTAVERPVFSFIISFGRSMVLLGASLIFLSNWLGEIGVWITPVVSEGLCLILSIGFYYKYTRNRKKGAFLV